jgi:hypothetical protein
MCHNCGASTSLGNFIKQLDVGLFKEYIMERYKDGEHNNKQFAQKTFNIPSPRFDKLSKELSYENAERCDKLPEGHFCLEYLKRRKIPLDKYKLLWYTSNYRKFVDEIYPEHDKKLSEDKRLIIPFYDEYNVLQAVSGRALETSEEKLRYVTVRTTKNENKLVYGCDRIILSQKVLLVEGPIDSLFLNNCLASGDANLSLTAKSIEAKDLVLVFDNEPRNKDIVKMMGVAIKSGHKIVIWPETMSGKDINEFVMNGKTPDDIDSIISSNTFSNIQAQLRFNQWKKI